MGNSKIYLVLIGIMLIWGLNVSVIKILVEHFMPVTITALRIFIASVTVFLVLGVLGKVRKPHSNEWLYIISGAMLSVVSHHYFLSTGLSKTTAANGGLILGLGPLLTALLSMILLKRRPTNIRLLGFLLGGTGVSFTVLAGDGGINSVSVGDLDIFLAILSQALSFIVIKKAAETLDPRLLTGYMLLIGSVLLFLISLWKEPAGLASLTHGTPAVWLAFLFSAVLATALGHMIYNHAIGQIGAAETSIFLNLNTFFSLVGAAVFLGEAILPAHLIGLLLIVPGVLLGSGSMEELVLRRRRKLQHR
ncbi:EamA family transporter [Bacillus aerolatus]|uniref:EamA family transporter n=1 Tax=Bacillus aerolatus TaxID=2653354 RepID=A0A6I1FI60_9BACI|nr:DMT family transporter [Bacillus aerolatus]KAB7705344.1 EamA family transporter [Bacillus aerolatus]